MKHSNNDQLHYIILGASLDTGNLGVSALLSSVAQGIIRVCDDAYIQTLDGVRNPIAQVVRQRDGSIIELGRVGVRCNKTVWRQNHILRLLGSAFFARFLPRNLRKRWLKRNPYLNAVVSAQAVMDITGGDSFSDIYGMRRMIFGSLGKLLVLFTGADLILLPQTYGPFRGWPSKVIARYVLSRASAVFSRDQEGLGQIQLLMDNRQMRATPQLCSDVAFVLDPIRPENEQVCQLENLKTQGRQLIGLNISGLLYNGGYTQDNMFGLACDYQELIEKVLIAFLEKTDVVVLLVPHVIPEGFPVENDLDACRKIWQTLPAADRSRVVVLDGGYDQNEIKYLISLCDFFLGARMHATIAALSQFVPAVGMAYSKKFTGVFQTVGVESCVADMRQLDEQAMLRKVMDVYEKRQDVRAQLKRTVAKTKGKVFEVFEHSMSLTKTK